MQFLIALNQTYIATHSLIEKGDVYWAKFLKAAKELKKGEELKQKLEEAKSAKKKKASVESDLAKDKVENMELRTQFLEFQRPSDRTEELCHPKWSSNEFGEATKGG